VRKPQVVEILSGSVGISIHLKCAPEPRAALTRIK
jgi:hypothetical protein